MSDNQSDNSDAWGQPTVFPLSQKRHDLQKLVEHIMIIVHQYNGRISVTEAIGALELAKLELYEEQKT